MSDTTAITGVFTPGEIDPLLEAIRQAIINAGEPGSAMAEFGADQVVIIAADESDAGIEAKIKAAIGKRGGLCLLLISGSGKNPDKSSPGPLITVALEAQLFVNTRVRAKDARAALPLVTALARTLHHAKAFIDDFAGYELLYYLGHDPLPDPDYTAFSIQFERELQL